MISNNPYSNTNSTDTYRINFRGYVTSGRPYYNGTPYPYYYYDPVEATHMSRRAQKLAQLQRDIDDSIKKFGKNALVARIAREEKERQVMLDARSRRKSPHSSTKRRDTRRLSTYEAAMAMRQLKR